MRRLIPLAATLLALSACATTTRGRTEEVKFTSVPSGARVTTDTETALGCTTPCALTIGRKEEFTATFTHGGRVRVVEVTTKASLTGRAAMAGNVLSGGVVRAGVGVGVDAASGATLDHVPNPVHVDFTQPPPAAGTATAGG